MLDWKRIVNDKDSFKKGLSSRGVDSANVSQVLAEIERVAADRIKQQQHVDELKSERNKSSLQVGELMKSGKKAEAQEIIARGKQLGEQIEALEKNFNATEEAFEKILAVIPNLPHESVPVGKSAADNPVVRSEGSPRKFDFQPKSHDEMGSESGLLDFERAAKISGARFTFLRKGAAQLERALINLMLDLHRKKGYEEISPPYMVDAACMYAIGQFPKFKEDVFKLEGFDKYLIPTAEVPVTAFFKGEIIPEELLPLRFVAFSPCFRSEAGSYGKDTRGLIRQHQFLKVELVKLTRPEESMAELESMVSNAEDVLRTLEIPFRTVHLCTGDMGFNSQKTYDIEAWLPGSVGSEGGQRGCYREISSCSNCGDFQARRGMMRYKPKGGKGTQYVHTLNGSGLAVGRTLIAVMENYQQADGSIVVPAALKPYMGGVERIPAK